MYLSPFSSPQNSYRVNVKILSPVSKLRDSIEAGQRVIQCSVTFAELRRTRRRRSARRARWAPPPWRAAPPRTTRRRPPRRSPTTSRTRSPTRRPGATSSRPTSTMRTLGRSTPTTTNDVSALSVQSSVLSWRHRILYLYRWREQYEITSIVKKNIIILECYKWKFLIMFTCSKNKFEFWRFQVGLVVILFIIWNMFFLFDYIFSLKLCIVILFTCIIGMSYIL